jgi:hypothetical protein
MKHVVTVRDAAPRLVVAQWRGEDDSALVAPNGYTLVDVTSAGLSAAAYRGKVWNGSAFVSSAASTVISKYRFLTLLTETEDAAIDLAEMTLAAGTAPQKLQAAKIRAWRRRLQAADHVDLAAPAVATQLQALRAVLIPSAWADSAAADARIAAILANETPA